MKRYFLLTTLAAALASTAVWAQDARPGSGSYGGPSESLNQTADTPATGAAGRSAQSGMPAMQGGKTRAEVKEELRRARESGELERLRESYVGGR